MQKLFNNILVPVSLERGTNETIGNAILFANQMQCNLHLVGIASHAGLVSFVDRIFPTKMEAQDDAERKNKLAQLQARYCQELEEGQMMMIHYERGDAEKVISHHAAIHKVDLVFIAGGRKGFSFLAGKLNVNRLAGMTHCPVLSLKSGPVLHGLKIIVLPVGTSLPINKIRIAAYLARHYHASIHLIAKERNQIMYEELAYMQKALQVLKDNTDLPVKCKTIVGENMANIALQYAHEVKAGLIVVNPGAESSLPGMINRLFSRFVFNESKIPVMTVA